MKNKTRLSHLAFIFFLLVFVSLNAFSTNVETDKNFEFPVEAALSKNERWIIIASRPTLEEAKTIEASYKSQFKDATIFHAVNDWYAIAIGKEKYPNAKKVIAQLIADEKIPKDSFLSIGNDLYSLSEKPSHKLKSVYLDKTNNVHVLTEAGKDIQITKSGKFSDVTLAENKMNFGWLNVAKVESFNPDTKQTTTICETCSNYAYTYTFNKIRRIEAAAPLIRSFYFVENGNKFVVDEGGLHFAGTEILYDTNTLKKLEEYSSLDDPVHEKAPNWSSYYPE